ncbi:hypothetical protein F5Y14DRAFT_439339 [Nemania sp. NC0429]|nr:hypothetical protein F5Y14DRAFT_439339 [Nemania sp. NC0429]
MGAHEPLTSLALGRSPYDDVVAGEGEADVQDARTYDEHGRVVNESSRQMNKDIIRAHNEVMHVIGVAEPEPSASSNWAAFSAKLHSDYENSKGRHFLRWGRLIFVAGVWGVHGLRQRILVYRETARLPFLSLLQREVSTHTASRLLFAGLPSFLGAWSLQWCSRASGVIRDNVWLQVIIGHVRFHLQIFVAMQRLDLIPGSRWFPSLNFFVPFSSSSPFIAPPPLGSPGAQSLPEWAGAIAVSLAPYASYYLLVSTWDFLSYFIRRQIHKSLPHPHPWPNSTTNLRALVPATAPQRPSFSESPTLGEADRDIRHTTQDPEVHADPLTFDEGAGESLPTGTLRRRGTFSSRGGDDYATDEEDPDMVNPTLISFDVDTSESTEPPPGIWSAELRPSNSGDFGTHQKEAPRYVVNTLTRLPSILAGDILTSSLTHILLTPFDILAFRGIARAFSLKFNLPIDRMLEVHLADGLVTRMMMNLFYAEVLKFVVSFGTWAVITTMSQRYHLTDEQWEEYSSKVELDIGEETAVEGQITDRGASSQ